MARPKKDGLDYFPHDVDSLTDPKLEPAIMLYGAAAFAFYFVHLEYCYKSRDLYIDISDTPAGMEMREVIQRKLHIPSEKYMQILDCLLRHGAFDKDEYAAAGHLTSNGIKKRAAGVFRKRANAASAYEQSKAEEATEEEQGEEAVERKSSAAELRDKERLDEARQIFAALPKKVRESVSLWLDYKKERHESYKPVAMLSLMKKVRDSVEDCGVAPVIDSITDSIASRYQGITWDKLRQGGGARIGTTNPFLDSDEEGSDD